MSALLSAQGALLSDAYTLLEDDAPLPDSGAVIVSLVRWQTEAATLAARTAPVAVKLANTVDVLTLAPDVLARPMLVLDFPAFGDGRAYSQARRLRERCGYHGRLRGCGAAVALDQLAMLRRVGFDELQLREDQSSTLAAAALGRSTLPSYQPDLAGSPLVTALRH